MLFCVPNNNVPCCQSATNLHVLNISLKINIQAGELPARSLGGRPGLAIEMPDKVSPRERVSRVRLVAAVQVEAQVEEAGAPATVVGRQFKDANSSDRIINNSKKSDIKMKEKIKTIRPGSELVILGSSLPYSGAARSPEASSSATAATARCLRPPEALSNRREGNQTQRANQIKPPAIIRGLVGGPRALIRLLHADAGTNGIVSGRIAADLNRNRNDREEGNDQKAGRIFCASNSELCQVAAAAGELLVASDFWGPRVARNENGNRAGAGASEQLARQHFALGECSSGCFIFNERLKFYYKERAGVAGASHGPARLATRRPAIETISDSDSISISILIPSPAPVELAATFLVLAAVAARCRRSAGPQTRVHHDDGSYCNFDGSHIMRAGAAQAAGTELGARQASNNNKPPTMIDSIGRDSETNGCLSCESNLRSSQAISPASLDFQNCRPAPQAANGNRQIKAPTNSRKGVASSQLMLLLISALSINYLVNCHRLAGAASSLAASTAAPKERFWFELVSSLLGPELSGTPETREALRHLATKLALWPDQNRAALFYLDLLGRRSRRDLAADPPAQERLACRRVTLAELTEPASAWADNGSDGPDGTNNSDQDDDNGPVGDNKLAQIKKLDLASEPKSIIISERLQADYADEAELAVESANLISRLLIHSNEHEVINVLASSQKFFKYLLEKRLRQRPPGSIHSLGLVFIDELESGGSAASSRFGSSFAPLASLDEEGAVSVRDLARHPVASAQRNPNNYFKLSASQPAFISKWMLLLARDPDEELPQLLERFTELASNATSGQAPAASLTRADGRWFSPFHDCGVTNRWLLTYSVPFFATSSVNDDKKKVIKLR